LQLHPESEYQPGDRILQRKKLVNIRIRISFNQQQTEKTMRTNSRYKFPDAFVWGVGTAAAQIEGAHAEDGKGESIWDRFSHTPGKIENNDTVDVACDHYHRFEDDIKLAKELKLGAYRFSISWPRVQPDGRGELNEKGMQFYDRLIDCILANGLEPFVTLYHWDLPQSLQDEGGWGNREIGHLFAAYAAKMVARYGDRVTFWSTFNEPWCSAYLGHAWGVHAPGLKDEKLAAQVAHNLLIAHGLATRAIRATAKRPLQVGIVLNQSTHEPLNPEDVELAEASWRGDLGQWMDPLFKGSYPPEIAARIGDLQTDDLATISQKIDYLGVNFYFRVLISKGPVNHPLPGASYTDMPWEETPSSLRLLLNRLWKDYDCPPIYVTENGAAYNDVVEADGRVHDARRINYIREHVKQLALTIEDGVNVLGYFAWSLMDNFEWAYGYSKRFGLLHVDYATQKRTIKDSGYWFAETAASNSVELAFVVNEGVEEVAEEALEEGVNGTDAIEEQPLFDALAYRLGRTEYLILGILGFAALLLLL
jgi:beta-glucosidase